MEQDLYGLQASGIDPEIAAQMLGLKRKRSVADALMQQALSPLKADRVAPGGLAVPISPWEGIAQLAKAYMGSKGLEDLDKQQGDLTRQNQAKVTEAISGYMQRRDGTAAQPIADAGPGDAVDTSTMLNGRAPDMKEAVKFGLTNNLLQNNPLVKMDAAAVEKSQQPFTLPAGAVRFGADGKQIASAEFKPQPVAPMFKQVGLPGNKEQEHISLDGGRTWNPVPGSAPTDKFNPRPTTQVTTKVDMPAGQKAFDVEIAKLDAKELDGLRDVATKAQNGLSRIAEMKKLADSGVYSGSFAEGRTGVANFFDTLGVPFDTKKLSNSQEYLKHAKELTLSLLKEGVGGSQISNADLKFVNDTVPQLETNPTARKNLLNYIEGRLASSVDRFNKADVYARKNGGLAGFAQQGTPAPKSGGLSPAEEQELAALRARFGR